ncbi:MAG TPA: hypothetical protein DIV82_00360 [Brevundimonas diminuta]|nr:hypothetical protein [Brevundimonas diminuta]
MWIDVLAIVETMAALAQAGSEGFPDTLLAAAMTASATFLAGMSAVIGALVVGLRQVEITAKQAGAAERQTEIQEKQAEILKAQTDILEGQLTLDRHRAKADLFDRRLAVYVASRDWLDELLRTGNAPNGQIHVNFAAAMDRAVFLFPNAVSDHLHELYDESVALRFQMNRNLFKRDAKRISDIMTRMLRERTDLRGIFSDAIGLQDEPMPGAKENRPQAQAS